VALLQLAHGMHAENLHGQRFKYAWNDFQDSQVAIEKAFENPQLGSL
jgi:hypothetical protein